jgi:transcriptional regulator GlxA family with amidase domain
MVAFANGNLIDIAGPMQAFATAGEIRDEAPYRLLLVSEDGGPVATAPGIVVETLPLSSLDGETIDTLIVPGGLPRRGPFKLDRLVAWLADNGERPRRLCSVCTGAFLLADAGLLVGKRCTTHWFRAEELRLRHPGLDVDADSLFIADGRVWTSGGVTAGIDLALALVEADCGHDVAMAVARELVVYLKRPGGQSQFSALLQSQADATATFDELNLWIAGHLGRTDLTVECLAERARMSPRNFARLYRQKTGRTPAKAVEVFRLEAARRLLEDSARKVDQIAALCGFGDEERMRVTFQRHLGVAPRDYRKRFARRGLAMISSAGDPMPANAR